MKKIILLSFVLLSSSIIKAQQSVIFKIKFLPNHSYKQNTKMSITMDMKVPKTPGSANNTNTPSEKKSIPGTGNSTTISAIQTGAVNAAGGFPIKFQYIDMTAKSVVNNVETPIPKNPLVGKVMTGECNAAGQIHIDSIPGSTGNPLIKKGITDMINKMQAQIRFPEKPMDIGESFTQETPMNIPAAGMNMLFIVKITYKLVSISGNLAIFDTIQTVSFDLNTDKNGTKLTSKGDGGGNGKMIYNISESYPQEIDNSIDMKYNMVINDKMFMDASMKIATDISTEITAN